jgi:hypothetical protein
LLVRLDPITLIVLLRTFGLLCQVDVLKIPKLIKAL